ncbi:DUF6011 domain-containing protein [Moheibacter stercoris]|uniref:Uncharacterized protein n=1 Tax=Moheibacter stercoris TaxID=1628251 RepID=A0ABV2LW65_9FLAO
MKDKIHNENPLSNLESLMEMQKILVKREAKKSCKFYFTNNSGDQIVREIHNAGLFTFNKLKTGVSYIKTSYTVEVNGFSVKIDPNNPKSNSLEKVVNLMRKAYKELQYDTLSELNPINYKEAKSKIDADARKLFPPSNTITLASLVELSARLLPQDKEVISIKHFSQKNIFNNEANNIIEKINKPDFIENQMERSFKNNNEEIKSKLTDFQVFSICGGVEESYLRKLSKKFFTDPNSISQKEIFEAHQAINNLIIEQGMEVVKFIMTLPPLPFGAMNADRIFSEFEKRRNLNDFPTLRLSLGKGKAKLIVSFFTKKGKIDNSVLEVKDKETKKVIMMIDRTGKVLPSEDAKNIIPTLLLFKEINKDENELEKLILNYGLETGECGVCGRALTNPASLQRGIGPVCDHFRNN